MIIFGQLGCYKCEEAKRLARENGIDCQYIDLDPTSPNYAELFALYCSFCPTDEELPLVILDNDKSYTGDSALAALQRYIDGQES